MPDTGPMKDDELYADEEWTYGGLTPGRTRARAAIWYDPDRHPLTFTPDARPGRLVVGGVYRVRVRRDGGQVWRRGPAEWARPCDDADWRAQLEAAAYAAEVAIARDQVERKAKAGGELAKRLADLEALAATMTYAQREGLVSLVTQRIYRARPPAR